MPTRSASVPPYRRPVVIASWFSQTLNIWWFTAIGLAAAGPGPLQGKNSLFDALIAASGKCIEGPPGMGFVFVRRSVLEKCEGRSTSLALDLHDAVSQKLFGVVLAAESAATLLDRDAVLVERRLEPPGVVQREQSGEEQAAEELAEHFDR